MPNFEHKRCKSVCDRGWDMERRRLSVAEARLVRLLVLHKLDACMKCCRISARKTLCGLRCAVLVQQVGKFH